MVGQSWYDVMQVCENGHMITAVGKSKPMNLQNNCSICGATTITKCKNCNEDIRGLKHIPGWISNKGIIVPIYCHNCGTPYPWTKKDEGKEMEKRPQADVQGVTDPRRVGDIKSQLKGQEKIGREMSVAGLNVFISSEMAIQEERTAADQAIRDLGHNPKKFEDFPAYPRHPIEMCLEQVEESDVVVLIIGERATEPTLKEYKKALTIGRDILIFIKKLSRSKTVDEIIKELQKRHTTKQFLTIDDLKTEIQTAIQYLIRLRVRAGQKPDADSTEQDTQGSTQLIIEDTWELETSCYCRRKIFMKKGQILKGEVYETDGDDFDFYIFSERQANGYFNGYRGGSAQWEHFNKGHYSVKWIAPRDGIFYLVADIYQRRFNREVHLELEIN